MLEKRKGGRDMRGEFVFKRFINNCCNAEYITWRRRSSVMGDDAYWRVPDGRDYYREIEPRTPTQGHIIQPFTSLSITHPSALLPPRPTPLH